MYNQRQKPKQLLHLLSPEKSELYWAREVKDWLWEKTRLWSSPKGRKTLKYRTAQYKSNIYNAR